MRNTYKAWFNGNGLSHDKLSRSAWRLAGLDPQARNAAALRVVAQRINRRSRRDAYITALLAAAWVLAVIAATA